jgi:CHASE2 domain-containing sensor protein
MTYPRLVAVLHVLAGFCALGAVWLGELTGIVGDLEWWWRGQIALTRIYGGNEFAVVVVEIDEASFQALKTRPELAEFKRAAWPWPPKLHALLLQKLIANGADRVGIDLLFSESYEQMYLPAYASAGFLIAARQQGDIPVVLAAKMETGILTRPLDVYLDAGFRFGLANLPPRISGATWKYDFWSADGTSFALALAEAEGGSRDLGKLGWTDTRLRTPQFLGFRQVGTRGFPRLSFTDVLLGRVPESVQERWKKTSLRDLIAGKAVMIGCSNADAHDLHSTPFGIMPGVFIHAHAFQMLSEPPVNLLREAPAFTGWGLLLAFIVAGVGLSYFSSGMLRLVMFLGLGAMYAGICVGAFAAHGLLLPLFRVGIGYGLGLILPALFAFTADRRRIRLPADRIPLTHDVFISYASPNKEIADTVCAELEDRKINCWIAPRNILPGMEYADCILQGIMRSRVIVLIFSGHADASIHVANELERALHHRKTIIPFRIENLLPSKSMEYLLSMRQWLDAFPEPAAAHYQKLADAVLAAIRSPGSPGQAPQTSPDEK